MSKSNNNHFTPDLFGEQKGDSSPFFLTPEKENLRSLLLKARADISFFSDKDLEQMSTFFHKDARDTFLRDATALLEKRRELAIEIYAIILELSEQITALAHTMSGPTAASLPLNKACAALSERIEMQERQIRTNIISKLNSKTLEIEKDNTFLQIKKDILLLEISQKALNSLPSDWEDTKRELLLFPPTEQTQMLFKVIEAYGDLETHLSSSLLQAAKAAKAQNPERYANILHKSVVHLCDTAALLKAIERKEV